jgi:hypothetical protein
MLQRGVAAVERDALVDRFVDVNFGAGEAIAPRLLGDLKAAAMP